MNPAKPSTSTSSSSYFCDMYNQFTGNPRSGWPCQYKSSKPTDPIKNLYEKDVELLNRSNKIMEALFGNNPSKKFD